MSDFKLVTAAKANGRIPVEKYRSASTGLTVVLAQVDGPVVNGYFVLATEAFDDDGLPHTLEHLIFLGSEEYPYKGVLDLLANRCLSSGTNAWTDTDHTCYTMTTAGSEGFLNLVPVYLDHILYPTLTDAGFVTEVHHVTGEGEDGGVVYCEMQGTQNTGESRTHLEMLRAMYPGECGYKSETGGIMENLRDSTTNSKVRAYHREFYRPENLCLIITGRVEPTKLFSCLEGIQNKIISKGCRGPYTRPWQNEVPSLQQSRELDVLYPADEEDNGMVYIAWRGPKVTEDLKGLFSMMILMEYLTETSVSPLQATFVEVDDPLASRVGYSFIENSVSTVYLTFDNVPRAKIPLVPGELTKVLGRLVSGEICWDEERLRTVIQRRVLEQISQIENSPHDAIAGMIIGDVLYGNTAEDFEKRLNSLDEYKQLLSESSSFWLNLIQTYLIQPNKVIAKGIPSVQLELDMKKEEATRIEQQRAKLGEGGLKEMSRLLETAMEENEKEAPEAILRSIDIPSAASIQFHPVVSSTTASRDQREDFDLTKMPVFFQFDQVSTNFVYIFTVMNTEAVPVDQKLLLPLLLELLLESGVEEGGELLHYEEVVQQLAKDFLVSSTGLGVAGQRFIPGAFSQAAVLYLQTQPEKYTKAVDWIRKLLFFTKFTPDRIRVLATKMDNSIAEMKRSGSKVVSLVLNSLVYTEQCNLTAASIIRQQAFLQGLLKQLESEPEKVVNSLEAVRSILTRPSNMMVHMAADLETLRLQGDPDKPWNHLLPAGTSSQPVSPSIVAECKLSCTATADNVIVGLGACESSFLARCVPSIQDTKDPDLPALMLFLQYLTQCEGPMWRHIRGAGLAYGYSLYASVSKGRLYLTLYRATHPVKAYKEIKQIAMSYVEGVERFDPTLLEAAKSSLIFELIEKEKTVGEVVVESLLSSFKGVDKDFNRELLVRIDKVTEEELKAVAAKYIPPLFTAATASTAVVCSPGKLNEIKDGFNSAGLQFRVLDSLDLCSK